MGFSSLSVLIAAFAIVGLFSFSAYADPGNVVITDVEFQGGVGFDVFDPDGIKSVTQLPGPNCPGETRVINADCSNPQITSVSFEFNTNHFCEPDNSESIFEIIDCQPNMEKETWFMEFMSDGSVASCIDNCDPPKLQVPVGGEFLQIESTSLLLAGAQTFSWMIPIVLSGIGIGLFVFRRSENS